jgi:hypothetical protein
MKTIYRVEHYDRRHGPYPASHEKMNGQCQELAEKLHKSWTPDQHPPPCFDGILDYSDDYYCGFDSLDALFDWFEQWLEELQAHNYHIAVFEVEENDTLRGGKQVMFKRKKYRRKQTLRLSEVRNETRQRIESVAELL